MEAAEGEETYHDAIKRTLEKTEALEKHVKTVTMRADSWVTAEADFFQTLIERQEESIRELNILYGQLCQPRYRRRVLDKPGLCVAFHCTTVQMHQPESQRSRQLTGIAQPQPEKYRHSTRVAGRHARAVRPTRGSHFMATRNMSSVPRRSPSRTCKESGPRSRRTREEPSLQPPAGSSRRMHHSCALALLPPWTMASEHLSRRPLT